MSTAYETLKTAGESLQNWIKENEPGDNMCYKNAWWSSVLFMREQLFSFPFLNRIEHADQCSCQVVAVHCSKSIVLPVIKIVYKKGDFELEAIFSDNFHMWSVSIECSQPVPDMVKALELFDTTVSSYCGLYGFPDKYQYGSYDDDQSKFSCTINDMYRLWAFWRVVTSLISK